MINQQKNLVGRALHVPTTEHEVVRHVLTTEVVQLTWNTSDAHVAWVYHIDSSQQLNSIIIYRPTTSN